ncbi:putative bifunctional diguanylate cyclase/phosphodiesterase [Novosphingobium album (ex Liu et al. 2023)]|uniref:EAL domain-containing protein n=1 Tax=Novosphingobium album (ex Liu et al. 2023) TaxID=3031130 RepID=A0ABT5WXQ7_9SPHN|nr:EAL domain-containing protein [Novosphingobium album (ex Liu et al. 2023)]MDE8654684.1 EAL domain-containing protein [Novosphingobium album (ex Liu et al. 2023)]
MVAAVRRLRGHIPFGYFWPLLLLTGTCLGCTILLLFVGARAQDTMQLEREEQALVNVLATATAMVRHDLQDYAKWDDAVRHLGRNFDADWMDDNVVAFLGRTQGYNDIFVLDGQDRTIFSFRDRAPQASTARQRLGPDFEASIRMVRRMPTDGSPIVSGFTRADGRVYLFATAAVVPLTHKVTLPDGPTKLIVIARVVDRDVLAEFTRDFIQKDMRLAAAPSALRPKVAIKGFGGQAIGWLTWLPHRPGTLLRQRLAPAIGVMALVALVAAGLVLRRGARAIDDLQRSELRARHLSEHDALTGLPNRRALVARTSEWLAQGERLSLLFMDLDGFKNANDLYGHGAGDLLLRETARRIRSAVGEAFVARAGGDEFAVLVRSGQADDVNKIAEAILGQFVQPFSLGAYNIKLGISIGFAEAAGAPADTQDEMMRPADVAMYAAKADGKNCARVYAPALDENLHLRLRLESDLRQAIEKEEIFVHYQPIIDAGTGVTVAVEALARWSDPLHGHVPPDVFIPIAEMSGLINAIGRQVLMAACQAMRHTNLDLAINLSPAQFWDGGLLDDVRTALEETGFPPERLELEITESLMLRHPQRAVEVVNSLRALGIRIALDDFGTGIASIGYLQQFQLDRLKIDKTFIAPIEHDAKAREMLVSITGLARACNLEICAEGIETDGQARLARMAGCGRLQGWLFGKPQAAAAVVNMLDDAERPRLHKLKTA